MEGLFDRDLLVVTGKGGVGKTTVAAALSLEAAAQGKRVLLAQCRARDRLRHILEVDRIEAHNRQVLPNLEVVNMEPQVALEEYGLMVLKVRALYRAVFENRVAQAFLRGTPGMDAWAMLGKAYHHATRDTLTSGVKRYDLVVLDAPATGHGIEMLRVPQVIADVAPPGLLRSEAERALELLRDVRRTGVVLVTLLEEMPVEETFELHQAIDHDLRYPLAGIVYNRVLPRSFPSQKRSDMLRLLRDLHPAESEVALGAAKRAALRRCQRESRQELAETTLAQLELPVARLSDMQKAQLSRQDIAMFGKAIAQSR